MISHYITVIQLWVAIYANGVKSTFIISILLRNRFLGEVAFIRTANGKCDDPDNACIKNNVGEQCQYAKSAIQKIAKNKWRQGRGQNNAGDINRLNAAEVFCSVKLGHQGAAGCRHNAVAGTDHHHGNIADR